MALSVYSAKLIQSGTDRHIERHDGCSDMPEYRLLEALLQEAADTYIYGDEHKRAWVDAERWFRRELKPNYEVNLYYDGITFAFVCDQLDLDESYVRKNVLEARESLKTVDSTEHSAV